MIGKKLGMGIGALLSVLLGSAVGMKKIIRLCSVCLLFLDCVSCVDKPIASTSQMVIVTTVGWDTSQATLSRFERIGKNWQQIGDTVLAVVGKNGLAWDRSTSLAGKAAQWKQEGDGRAPAGVFKITEAMGYGRKLDTALSYTQATSYHRCVDDSASPSYNRIVDTRRVEKTWNSSEEMKRSDHLYNYLAVVDYNGTEPDEHSTAGAGSCIFLHVWRSSENGTAGCTAISEPHMVELLRWLRPGAFLVQLPEREYVAHRHKLGLPASQKNGDVDRDR